MLMEFTGRWYLVNQRHSHGYTVHLGGYWTRWGAEISVRDHKRYGFGGDWYVLPVSEFDQALCDAYSGGGIYPCAAARYPDAARKYAAHKH